MTLPTPSSSPQKRKHEEISESPSASAHKKAKKDKKKDKKSKEKRRKVDGEFQLVSASLVVSIPPRFSLDPLSGVKEMLDSLVMKYVPALQGVMLCHTNAHFLSDKALLKSECPYLVCTVAFDATVWSPQIGMKLTGKINLCSPDHIALLVHRTFNVSIPREHIPTENWVFEYGPAENDPEFGPHAVESQAEIQDTGLTTETDGKASADDANAQSEPHLGSWVHRITGDKLGGKEGILEFTVIGMTVANQMLSLKGSLQPDPFSPHHVPQPAVPSAQLDDEADEAEEREVSATLPSQHSPEGAGAVDDSDDEEDPFAHLNLVRDEAVTAKEREKEEKEREKEEKKTRKKERKERKEKEKALAAVDASAAVPSTTEPTGTCKGEKPPGKKRKKETQEA